jgi:hypothetical protein
LKYDAFMDPECIEICDALNEIPGIETMESCCGHGKFRFSVWFKASDLSPLFIIGRITSRNYMPVPQWKCRIEIIDSDHKNPVRFHLSSGKTKGKKAYKQASHLARCIRRYVSGDWKWISEKFGVKL